MSTWQSSMESLKGGSCAHWRHATVYTPAKIETPLMFQISPLSLFTHCHYYLYIYPDIPPLYLFIFLSPPICASLATTDQNWWKVVDVTKALKGIWIFIRGGRRGGGRGGCDLRARQAVSSQRNGGKITAIFTLMITFKLISISWRDVEIVNWHIFHFSISKKKSCLIQVSATCLTK